MSKAGAFFIVSLFFASCLQAENRGACHIRVRYVSPPEQDISEVYCFQNYTMIMCNEQAKSLGGWGVMSVRVIGLEPSNRCLDID